jgi:hypothetical protein
MAWPFTFLTNYIANSVPVIKALDLNKFQEYFGHIFAGTRTVKKLHADGTGDQTTTLPDGSLGASRSLNSLTLPTDAAAAGEFTKDSAVAALASFSGLGGTPVVTVAKGIQSIVRNGAGDYSVTFVRKPVGPWGPSVQYNSVVSVGWDSTKRGGFTKSLDGSGRIVLNVRIEDSAGTPTDSVVDVMAYIF